MCETTQDRRQLYVALQFLCIIYQFKTESSIPN